MYIDGERQKESGRKKDILNIIMLIACSMMCHDSVEKKMQKRKKSI